MDQQDTTQTGEQPDSTEQEHQEQVEQSPDSPDEGAGPAVEPQETSPGEGHSEQEPRGASAPGFNPDAPAPISPPPADAQSGVPQPTDGSNEGVEAQPEYAGPVDQAQADQSHAEANTADGGDTGDQ